LLNNIQNSKKLAGNVSKHVAVLQELSRLVGKHHLLEISEIEQDISMNDKGAQFFKDIKTKLQDPNLELENKIRLVMLYALRYENKNNDTDQLISALQSVEGITPEQIQSIHSLLLYAGSGKRIGDVFAEKTITNKFGFKTVFQGLKGVDNIYTQHKPLLRTVLESVRAGNLSHLDYPFHSGGPKDPPPKEVIVFMIGGFTYEEVLTVQELNAEKTMKIILGGTYVHNSKSFIRDVSTIKKKE